MKRTVGKANKGINVEKIIIDLKNQKLKKREKEKRKTPQNCKSPRQSFITTIKNVTEEEKKAQKLN